MIRRLRVLISAFYCEPIKGSEEGVGWNTSREIARQHAVWVLTRSKNRQSIESSLSHTPVPGLHFVYCDLPGWISRYARGQLLEWHVYYYLWQVYVFFVARRLHREVRFDIVHHVTFVKYWIPSFLAFLPVPFVWGPVGGGESAPKSFWRDFNPRARVSEAIRNLARWSGEHDPFVRLTARRSSVARATTEETAERMAKLGAHDVRLLSQLGLPEEDMEGLGRLTVGEARMPLRFVSVGRLVHWKGFHLGLRAFSAANLGKEAEYWIVGDGVERGRLEALAEELKIEDRVRFWGALPRPETLARIGECHVLVHPSLHDSGGGVCLEAMAAGRPVVCLDTGGPGVLITSETGLKVPAINPEQAVHDLSDAFVRLYCDPILRAALGKAGRKEAVQSFSWEARGRGLVRLYEEALRRT